MSSMHVVYCPHTDHVLAVHQAVGTQTPSVASLVGERGLRVSGLRGEHPSNFWPLNWGTPTTEREAFWISPTELALKTLRTDPDVFTRPYSYVVDSTQVAYLAPTAFKFRFNIMNEERVRLTTPAFTGNLSFATPRRVWIQIEGPSEGHRRVLASVIAANDTSPWDIPITVDPDGPLAPLPLTSGTTYHLLLLVEGLMPDARTQVM